MSLTDGDIATIWLTLRLATTVTILLLIFATPVAWWLARTNSWFKGPLSAIVALPLVLPPTVLGFYLLLAMGYIFFLLNHACNLTIKLLICKIQLGLRMEFHSQAG